MQVVAQPVVFVTTEKDTSMKTSMRQMIDAEYEVEPATENAATVSC